VGIDLPACVELLDLDELEFRIESCDSEFASALGPASVATISDSTSGEEGNVTGNRLREPVLRMLAYGETSVLSSWKTRNLPQSIPCMKIM